MKLMKMETITTQTLLGIVFWDAILARTISDGLVVKAQRFVDIAEDDDEEELQRIGKPVYGYSTPSGVIAFRGLSEHENLPANQPSKLWNTTPEPEFVVVDVEDRQGRYLPLSFAVQLPQRKAWRGRGAWLETPLMRPIPANANDDKGVMLWSSAVRAVPNGYTVIRAQIVQQLGTTLSKAPYAVVEVTQQNPPLGKSFNHFGIADKNGTVTLILPYPHIPTPANGDGRRRGARNAAPSYPQLDKQTFTLDFRIRYEPANQSTLPGSHVPNMASILTQDFAAIGSHIAAPGSNNLTTVATLRRQLQFGNSLILRTRIGAADAEESESVLRIQ